MGEKSFGLLKFVAGNWSEKLDQANMRRRKPEGGTGGVTLTKT